MQKKVSLGELKKKKKRLKQKKMMSMGLQQHNQHNQHQLVPSHSHSHSHVPSKERIVAYRKNLFSDDVSKQLHAVSQLRILLSDEQQPPIDLVMKANCVPRLVEILRAHQMTHQELKHQQQGVSRKLKMLLFETAWVLTNICSGSHVHTMAVVESGGIECILALILSVATSVGKACTDEQDMAVLEQSIWILGNIAGDGTAARDICLRKGVLSQLIWVHQQLSTDPQAQPHGNGLNRGSLHQHLSVSFRRNLVWTISNLVRGKPQPLWCSVSSVIPLILLYLDSSDIEVLTDTCWALSYLSDGCNEHIQSILDLSRRQHVDISAYLVTFLERQSMNVLVPALRTCGNIVSGSDHQTQQIIDRGLLTKLRRLLLHENHSVKKEAIWTVSNITAGNPAQIQAVIEHQLIEPLVAILTDYHADHDLVKECIWAISNATTGGTLEQLRYLSQYASIGLSRVMAHFPCDHKLMLVLLEGLDNLLSFTQKHPIPIGLSPLRLKIDMEEDTESDSDSDDSLSVEHEHESGADTNYVAHIMEQTEAHRILEKWYYDANQDHDVARLAQSIYKKYFNVPFQF